MWETELIEMLRALLFDLDETPEYSDPELSRVLLIAAHYVAREADFINTYVVDVSKQSISPDPSSDDYRDMDYLNFVALKAACLMNIGKSRIDAAKSVLIKDDRNTYDFKGVAQSFLQLIQLGHCKMYKDAMKDFKFNRSGELAEAVLSPFRTIAGGSRRITFYKA